MARQKKSISASDTPSFGEWLRQMRDKIGVPIRVVAAAAAMDQAHLSKVELGHRLPTKKQTEALARYFKVDSNEMEARRIAGKFRQDFAGNPAAAKALQMLNNSEE